MRRFIGKYFKRQQKSLCQNLNKTYFIFFFTARGPLYTVNNIPESHRKPFIEARNSTYHGSGPREEARAMCSVRTQEVNATANATITRRLHGVVTSRELELNKYPTISRTLSDYGFSQDMSDS